MQQYMVGVPLREVMRHAETEVIPEVNDKLILVAEGVQAFPPANLIINNPITIRRKQMGLDIYLSKKTFIGAMFHSRGISGIIELFCRNKRIPVELKRLSYIIEDIYHGRKTWWILDWLDHELKDRTVENGTECTVETDLIDRLHKTCIEVLEHKGKPDFRKVCKEKLHYYLKDDMDEEDIAEFVRDLEKLRDATDRTGTNDDVSFFFTASW